MTLEEKAIVDILNNSSLTITSDGKPLTVIAKEYSLIASEIVVKVKNLTQPDVGGSLGSIREKLWQKKLRAEGSMANPPEGACPEYKDRMLGRSWGLAEAIELLPNDR